MNILAVMPRQPLTSQRQYLKPDRMELKRPPLPPPPPPPPPVQKAHPPSLHYETCAPETPTVYVSSRFLAIKSSIEKFNEKKQKKTVSFQLEENSSGYDDNNNDDVDYQADISCAEKDTEKCRVRPQSDENCGKFGENLVEKIPENLQCFLKTKTNLPLVENSVKNQFLSTCPASLSGVGLVLCCSESGVWKQFSIGFGDGSCKFLLILNNEFLSNFFKQENYHFPSSSFCFIKDRKDKKDTEDKEEEKAGSGEQNTESSSGVAAASSGGEESFSSTSSCSAITNTSTPLDNENRGEVDAGKKDQEHHQRQQQQQNQQTHKDNNKGEIVKVSVGVDEDEEDLSSSPGSLENAFKASNRLQRLEEHFKGFVHCSNRKFKPSLDSLSSGSSEFDTRYPAYDELIFNFECYDELLEDFSDYVESEIEENSEVEEEVEEEGECNCDCDICKTSKMRELNGQLRGLLKKPNRPPPARKNRVVFDETRNEFFEADYIILIREDCAYDEEDEEPCTCGEHELVRLCCEEGCQCNYTNSESANNGGAGTTEGRPGQNTKYPPNAGEFSDEAALSPPDGYKDNGLKTVLGGALSGHIFGAQHIQQLQVIQQLQQQRAAMLAAKQQQSRQHHQHQTAGGHDSGEGEEADDDHNVCTECVECVECAAKQSEESENDLNSTAQSTADEIAPLGVPSGVALLPLHTTSSPERRITQKEIIAGEERPKYILPPQYKPPAPAPPTDVVVVPLLPPKKHHRFLVQTITTTTTCVTEQSIVQETPPSPPIATSTTKDPSTTTSTSTTSTTTTTTSTTTTGTTSKTTKLKQQQQQLQSCSSTTQPQIVPPLPPKQNLNNSETSTTLRFAKYTKAYNSNNNYNSSNNNNDDNNDCLTCNNINCNVCSVSVFVNNSSSSSLGGTGTMNPDVVPLSEKDQQTSSLERADKKPPIPAKPDHLVQQQQAISGILKGGKLWKSEHSSSQSDDGNSGQGDEEGTAKRSVRFVSEDGKNPNRDGDGQAEDDTENQINELIPIKKHSTLFNNVLRPNSAMRQLFPAAPCSQGATLTSEALRAFDESKKTGTNMVPALMAHTDTIQRNILRRSLIKKKTPKCETSLEERIKQLTMDIEESSEEPNSEMTDELNHRDSPAGEENPQKSFSPSSSISSSSSGSSSAYKKISDIFSRDRKQDKIPEMEENPIVIIPQECRCPAAPDLGMGVQVPAVHTQIHQTPPRQMEPKRQFLSTLAPLTACVAGQKDDLGYYTLASAPTDRNAAIGGQYQDYNNASDNESVVINDSDTRKVAPDVIAGTPGQEQQQDELAAFAQQESNRTEKIKKRYTSESNVSSDDDEQNDYGFNKRPSVRGIKPKFGSTNEILQQMQEQLQQQIPNPQPSQQQKSFTLPKQGSTTSIASQQKVIQPQPQQTQQPQPQPQPQQIALQQQGIVQPAQHTERTWAYYQDGSGAEHQHHHQTTIHPGYYQTLPAAAFRHAATTAAAYHGHEESLMYQNCQSVTMEQHYSHQYARSPSRRPESPPPLRNYHQTMVLIPHNAETYLQYAAVAADPKLATAHHQIHRQNILEYQQVTQQTIRVPIGYTIPGMQLHVVANRGQTAQFTQQQQQHPRILATPRAFNYPGDPSAQQQLQQQQQQQQQQQLQSIGFPERGVPEGAAAVSLTDGKNIISPTSSQLQLNQPQPPANQQQPGSVYYAMNV